MDGLILHINALFSQSKRINGVDNAAQFTGEGTDVGRVLYERPLHFPHCGLYAFNPDISFILCHTASMNRQSYTIYPRRNSVCSLYNLTISDNRLRNDTCISAIRRKSQCILTATGFIPDSISRLYRQKLTEPICTTCSNQITCIFHITLRKG